MPGDAPSTRTASLTERVASLPLLQILLPPLLVVTGMGVATYSVVRYRFWIVAVYVVLAVLLGAWTTARRPRAAGQRRKARLRRW